jgi:hypothetical protein
MIEVTVGELKPGDQFRVLPQGNTREYTVKSISTTHGDTALLDVYVTLYDRPVMTTTMKTKVWVESMVRQVSVPCLALTHEGPQPSMLHDLAKGPRPRGIFCGECSAAADAASGD